MKKFLIILVPIIFIFASCAGGAGGGTTESAPSNNNTEQGTEENGATGTTGGSSAEQPQGTNENPEGTTGGTTGGTGGETTGGTSNGNPGNNNQEPHNPEVITDNPSGGSEEPENPIELPISNFQGYVIAGTYTSSDAINSLSITQTSITWNGKKYSIIDGAVCTKNSNTGSPVKCGYLISDGVSNYLCSVWYNQNTGADYIWYQIPKKTSLQSCPSYSGEYPYDSSSGYNLSLPAQLENHSYIYKFSNKHFSSINTTKPYTTWKELYSAAHLKGNWKYAAWDNQSYNCENNTELNSVRFSNQKGNCYEYYFDYQNEYVEPVIKIVCTNNSDLMVPIDEYTVTLSKMDILDFEDIKNSPKDIYTAAYTKGYSAWFSEKYQKQEPYYFKGLGADTNSNLVWTKEGNKLYTTLKVKLSNYYLITNNEYCEKNLKFYYYHVITKYDENGKWIGSSSYKLGDGIIFNKNGTVTVTYYKKKNPSDKFPQPDHEETFEIVSYRAIPVADLDYYHFSYFTIKSNDGRIGELQLSRLLDGVKENFRMDIISETDADLELSYELIVKY